ncbi:immunity protein YezG family protein [Marinobacter sp. ANT_B65]|uniref:immunity protein YezG family protein n=1 Tax=Marinobacter sp. ANT_B65 TaxID=2039467 RepID=UPI000BBE4CBA|nr:immunity protein YezG family protein [Marinobacter sp. ANT_B65]PCM43910.1 hypothetical protein CPA50_10235 [Marinobacter sp. ANT_B65]
MEKTVDELYHEIAQGIVDAIDGEWQSAEVNFEYTGDSGEFDCVYVKEGGEQNLDFDVEFPTYKAFKAIHEITTEGGSNPWNRAKFVLERSGKFSIDFEWDQQLEDEIKANS